jgi:hypothetical protein
VLSRRRIKLRKEELQARSEEGTRKHIFKGRKNEGQSGTIYSAYSGKGSANNGIGS